MCVCEFAHQIIYDVPILQLRVTVTTSSPVIFLIQRCKWCNLSSSEVRDQVKFQLSSLHLLDSKKHPFINLNYGQTHAQKHLQNKRTCALRGRLARQP